MIPATSKKWKRRVYCAHGTCTSNTSDINPNVMLLPFPKPCAEYIRTFYNSSVVHRTNDCPRCKKCIQWMYLCKRVKLQHLTDINSDTYICSKHFYDKSGPTGIYPDPFSANKSEAQIERARSKMRKPPCRPPPKPKAKKKEILKKIPVCVGSDSIKYISVQKIESNASAQLFADNPVVVPPKALTTILSAQYADNPVVVPPNALTTIRSVQLDEKKSHPPSNKMPPDQVLITQALCAIQRQSIKMPPVIVQKTKPKTSLHEIIATKLLNSHKFLVSFDDNEITVGVGKDVFCRLFSQFNHVVGILTPWVNIGIEVFGKIIYEDHPVWNTFPKKIDPNKCDYISMLQLLRDQWRACKSYETVQVACKLEETFSINPAKFSDFLSPLRLIAEKCQLLSQQDECNNCKDKEAMQIVNQTEFQSKFDSVSKEDAQRSIRTIKRILISENRKTMRLKDKVKALISENGLGMEDDD